MRGTAGEHQREGAVGPGVQRGDAWGGGEAGVGLRPVQRGGERRGAVSGKQRSRQAEEEDRDLNAISKNSRDHSVNQR